MIVPHILAVGLDQSSMHSRAMILRHAGFVVDEAYNLHGALALVRSDSIDVLLLCHTLPKDEQRWLISEVRNERWLIPIICVQIREHDLAENGCVKISNDPVELLRAVKDVIQFPLPEQPERCLK